MSGIIPDNCKLLIDATLVTDVVYCLFNGIDYNTYSVQLMGAAAIANDIYSLFSGSVNIIWTAPNKVIQPYKSYTKLESLQSRCAALHKSTKSGITPQNSQQLVFVRKGGDVYFSDYTYHSPKKIYIDEVYMKYFSPRIDNFIITNNFTGDFS